MLVDKDKAVRQTGKGATRMEGYGKRGGESRESRHLVVMY